MTTINTARAEEKNLRGKMNGMIRRNSQKVIRKMSVEQKAALLAEFVALEMAHRSKVLAIAATHNVN